MFKSKKVLGTLAIDPQTGRSFGRVKNIILDIEKKRAAAVILPGKSWLYPNIWIDIGFVRELGSDALIISSTGKILSTKDIPNVKEEFDKGIRKIWGIMVVTDKGRLIGYLADLFLDFPSGDIVGVEVSRGLIGDVLQGRCFLPSESILALSFENVIVKEEECG